MDAIEEIQVIQLADAQAVERRVLSCKYDYIRRTAVTPTVVFMSYYNHGQLLAVLAPVARVVVTLHGMRVCTSENLAHGEIYVA